MGGAKDAVSEGGLFELALGFLADLRFEIGIGGDEKSCLAGVDAGLAAIEASAENLGSGKMDVNVAAADVDVVGLESCEVDAGDDVAMNEHEQAITGEKVGKNQVLFGAGDDFVHGIDDGFKPRQTLDAIDNGGLRGIDDESAAGDGGVEAADQAGPGVGGMKDDRGEDEKSGQGQDDDEENDEKGTRTGTARRAGRSGVRGAERHI